MPRSGSSLTAGIFSQHGVWTGRCRPADTYNPKGFFENLDIKKLLLKHFGNLTQKMREAEFNPDFLPEARNVLPDEFLVKHSAMYANAWQGLDVKFIFVRRDLEANTNSCFRTGMVGNRPKAQIREIIISHHEVMDRIEREHGGVNVFTDELVEGNYESIKEALEYCGLTFNQDIVEGFINKDYWHYASRTAS